MQVSLSLFILPHPKVSFIYSKTLRSSLCKAILNTNSKPDTSFFSFNLFLIKKLDSASQRPINHSMKDLLIEDLGNSLWTSVENILTWYLFFILVFSSFVSKEIKLKITQKRLDKL